MSSEERRRQLNDLSVLHDRVQALSDDALEALWGWTARVTALHAQPREAT